MVCVWEVDDGVLVLKGGAVVLLNGEQNGSDALGSGCAAGELALDIAQELNRGIVAILEMLDHHVGIELAECDPTRRVEGVVKIRLAGGVAA